MTTGRLPSVEGGIQPTVVDAKGDLLVATAADTVSRIAVGANDTVLTADSSTATGVKWATPAAASPASGSAVVTTTQTTTSSTYTDLTTSGPAVTLTTGTKALVIVTCLIFQSQNEKQGYAGYAVSGATTIAATDDTALFSQTDSTTYPQQRASAASRLTTLNAGSNTFTMKYRTNDTTAGYFSKREIIVIDLGS
jgi:hypothetical protein